MTEKQERRSFDPHVQLMDKIERCYEEYEAKWLRMTPKQLLFFCEEVYAVTLTHEILALGGVPNDAAGWLLRFKDPLQVISDAWRYANDLDSCMCESRFDALIDEWLDKRDAEEEYTLEDWAQA